MFDKLFGAKEPKLTLRRSMEELEFKQQANSDTWGLGSAERWDMDLEDGTITFSGWEDKIVTAPIQVIGTYNSNDGTWLWGWDHPSVSFDLARDARLVREFGAQHRLAPYTQRKIACSQNDAWQFTALALHLAQAEGAYRGSSGTTLTFMTFGAVTIQRPN